MGPFKDHDGIIALSFEMNPHSPAGKDRLPALDPARLTLEQQGMNLSQYRLDEGLWLVLDDAHSDSKGTENKLEQTRELTHSLGQPQPHFLVARGDGSTQHSEDRAHQIWTL
jgi:hypothetical protein